MFCETPFCDLPFSSFTTQIIIVVTNGEVFYFDAYIQMSDTFVLDVQQENSFVSNITQESSKFIEIR